MIKLTTVTEDLELEDNKYYYTRVELTGAGCDLVPQLVPESCSKGVEIHCLQTGGGAGGSCISAYYKTLMKPVDMAYLKHFIDMFVAGIEVKIQLVSYE